MVSDPSALPSALLILNNCEISASISIYMESFRRKWHLTQFQYKRIFIENKIHRRVRISWGKCSIQVVADYFGSGSLKPAKDTKESKWSRKQWGWHFTEYCLTQPQSPVVKRLSKIRILSQQLWNQFTKINCFIN